MKKKSLMISDKDRFGENSPTVAMAEKESGTRKTAPTITLVGPQVDAFCACALEVGEKGIATVHFVVKAVSAGDKYGSDVPTSKKPKEVVLSLTHATANEEPDGDESGEDDDDDGDGNDSEGDDESPAEPETDAPAAKKKSVSPKDAALED